MMPKPRLAVYKFTSCDGCQLSLLNAGEALLTLNQLVEIVHFAEAGLINAKAKVDIALIEGSVTTPDDLMRVKEIRKNSDYVVTLGACATSGGLQALRNIANYQEWVAAIYTNVEHIHSLSTSTPVSDHIKVDAEIWGCPVSTEQVFAAIRSLLSNALPHSKHDAVCLECKRKGNVCVLVTKKQPCMGAVTKTGCGALCLTVGRACYACYGPKENTNTTSLGNWFVHLGLSTHEVANLFLNINSHAPAFHQAGQYFKGIKIINE